ncbi:MAG TPA: CoA-binding protein [Steroidobacteraceae bacterium]|nr:CoA-binding protein [Steroidobacteraceae bacterium]
MTFQNPSNTDITALLLRARCIAVVGLSGNPARPSYEVTETMVDFGYNIIPINPTLTAWQKTEAFPTLAAAVTSGARIDIVNVFRQPRHVGAVVDECLQLKLPALWLQLGVIDETAAVRARDAGMTVVMDRCIKVERMRI